MLPHTVHRSMHMLCDALHSHNANVLSVYIYGSVALGGYIEGSSDIDFIAIVRDSPSSSDIQAISAAHQAVESAMPQTDIMGAYVLESDLGKPQNEIQSFLTYYNKQLHTDGTGSDLNPVTWWMLKQRGIQVHGPTQPINYHIEFHTVADYVIDNMNTYWLGWIQRLEHQLPLIGSLDHETAAAHLDEAVEWCTLGMLRQLYTLHKHDIKTKVEAGTYGIATLPQRWHNLIYEAISIKQRLPMRYYRSNQERLTDLIALLRYIHTEANLVYEAFPSLGRND